MRPRRRWAEAARRRRGAQRRPRRARPRSAVARGIRCGCGRPSGRFRRSHRQPRIPPPPTVSPSAVAVVTGAAAQRINPRGCRPRRPPFPPRAGRRQSRPPCAAVLPPLRTAAAAAETLPHARPCGLRRAPQRRFFLGGRRPAGTGGSVVACGRHGGWAARSWRGSGANGGGCVAAGRAGGGRGWPMESRACVHPAPRGRYGRSMLPHQVLGGGGSAAASGRCGAGWGGGGLRARLAFGSRDGGAAIRTTVDGHPPASCLSGSTAAPATTSSPIPHFFNGPPPPR